MLPIRDNIPAPTTPWIVYALGGVNVTAFFVELGMPHQQLAQFLYHYGLVPYYVTGALHGQGSLLGRAVIPAFSSMFLHGGWAHLLGNMWFLVIFGDNVEGRLGHLPFLGFYLLCGLAAAAGQYMMAPAGRMPTIGASGAIAGVLGAYVLCWPTARVLTLIPILIIPYFVELPAVVVLGFWFLLQFLQGAASLGVQFAHGGVAYGAHVVGFVVGAALVLLLPRARRRRQGA